MKNYYIVIYNPAQSKKRVERIIQGLMDEDSEYIEYHDENTEYIELMEVDIKTFKYLKYNKN